jgi:hypothetical protein
VVQQVDLQLTNVIRITFTNTGTGAGSMVNIPLNNISQMTNGVTSANQNLSVNSTKPFNVNVKAVSSQFTYSGTNQNNNSMQVQDVLKLRVNQNNTGGSIGNSFGSFQPITSSTQNIINGGDNGANKTFRIKYKATPDLQYAAGNYTTSIIFTATQQ